MSSLQENEDIVEVSDTVEEEIVHRSPSPYKKSENMLTFTCTKCKKVITINSDMFTKEIDKKSMHVCARSAGLPQEN